MPLLQPVRVTPTRSYWLQEALHEAHEPELPSLDGTISTDVAIIGGGYTGLWTALRIKELAPETDVTVLEADIAGGGASGRNGGLVLGWTGKLKQLVAVCGEEEAVRLAKAAAMAVDDIGAFCRAHDIDAHYRKAGLLSVATTPLHIQDWHRRVEHLERIGLSGFERVLAPGEAAKRGGSARYLGGVLQTHAATIQPAILARGMRRVALERGIRVFENTPVTEIIERPRPVLTTPRGQVIASKVALATNAWAAGLQELRRAIIVLSSDMIVTGPARRRIEQTGWTGGEGITDSRLMVHYHQVTHDGRIAIGRGSGALAYLGQVTAAFNEPGRRSEPVEQQLRRYYPTLATVPITHRWSGAVDRSRTNTLVFGPLGGNQTIWYGVGYSGTGVAPSLIGGRILASSLLELEDEWSTSRLNRGAAILYPREPVRYFGGLLVREATRIKEDNEERGATSHGAIRAVASLAAARSPRHPVK